jgi:cation:H+ antiporter
MADTVSTGFAVVAFVVALAATLGASEVLVWGLSRLGLKLGLAAGLLGLLTALGADAPEIASATSAVLTGARDVGIGVILGSNLFNLAALLGLPGLLAGRLSFPRMVPVADGTANVVITLLAAGMLLGLLPMPVTVSLFLVVLAGYVALLALSPRRVRRLPLPAWARRALGLLSAQVHPEDLVVDVLPPGHGWLPVWMVPAALAVIVAGSLVMVTTALLLGQRWHVPDVVLGTVALAAITGLPNLYAAVRLALRDDGATVVSEAFNSNTLNLVVGLGLPAVVIGAQARASGAASSLAWLGGMTVAAIAIAALQRGLTRTGGAAIVLLYAGFLAVLLQSVR